MAFFICTLGLAGCATAPSVLPPKPEGMSGIYHRLEKGETLWRISKIYNADIDKIVKINRIPDTSKMETGRVIFIPCQDKQQTLSDKPSLTFEDFIWPVRGKIISAFGQTKDGMLNKGVNIQPYKTSDGVVASRSGRVAFYAPDFKSFGKTIIIEHADGFSTIYTGNSQVFVKPGDSVQRGMLIAKSGWPYLHFQIRKGHSPQNPIFYLP